MNRRDIVKLCIVPAFIIVLSLAFPLTIERLIPQVDTETAIKREKFVKDISVGTISVTAPKVIRVIEASSKVNSANEKLFLAIADYSEKFSHLLFVLAVVQIAITVAVFRGNGEKK